MIAYALLTILLYSVIVFAIYGVFVRKYEQISVIESQGKIHFLFIPFFSLIFALFYFILTEMSGKVGKWGGDLANYYYKLENNLPTSEGLDFLYGLLRNINFSFVDFLFFTTFVCTLLALSSFRKCSNVTPVAILFFLCTDFVFLTFAQLKQCYACAFACLFFSDIMEKSLRLKNVRCFFWAVLASSFHTTGYILFPILILMNVLEKKKNSFILIMFIFICLLFVAKPLLIIFSGLSQSVLPVVSLKIAQYFIEENSIAEGGSALTFIKGAPFYFITLWAFVRKKNYSDIISNYDGFLFVSVIGSVLYLFSIESYWMFRFTAIFYFPMAVFWGKLFELEQNLFDRYFLAFLVFATAVIVRFRHIILMYLNYGGY